MKDAVTEKLIQIAKSGIDHGRDSGTITDLLYLYSLRDSEYLEENFLRILTTHLTSSRGAYQPDKIDLSEVSQPDQESCPYSSLQAAEITVDAITMREHDLVDEALRIIASRKKHIHPYALPSILSSFRNKSELYFILHKVLGERAFWLASINPEWKWWIELNRANYQKVDSQFLYQWIIYQRNFGKPIEAALQALSLKEQQKVLNYFSTQPKKQDESIAHKLIDARSPLLRRHAVSILLQLDTEFRNQSRQFIKHWSSENIKIEKNKIKFSSLQNTHVKLPFNLDEVSVNCEYLEDPLERLFSVSSPEDILAHLQKEPDEVFELLNVDEDLSTWLQITALTIADPAVHIKWKTAFCYEWLKVYPSGNTARVDFGKLFESINYDMFQDCIEILMRDDGEYFGEKVFYFCRDSKQYIGKKLSKKLLLKIFDLLTMPQSRTEVSYLTDAIEILPYRLDPRILNEIVNDWIEVDSRYPLLEKNLYRLKHIITKRSALLSSVID